MQNKNNSNVPENKNAITLWRKYSVNSHDVGLRPLYVEVETEDR